jgi:hypothetical protein
MAKALAAVTAAAITRTLLRTLLRALDISTSLIRRGGHRQLQDGVEDPSSGRAASRFGGRTSGTSRVEQPSLEDDPHGPVIADEGDVRDA